MDSEDYKKFKKEVYYDFLAAMKVMKISYRIDREKVADLIEKDRTVTIQIIKNDFKEYPLIQDSILDNNQVVLFPK